MRGLSFAGWTVLLIISVASLASGGDEAWFIGCVASVLALAVTAFGEDII